MSQEQDPVLKWMMVVVGMVLGILIGLAKVNTGGNYYGGEGSSHKGGHYENSATDNHYRSRK